MLKDVGRTIILLTGLSALFMAVGGLISGTQGIVVAFIMSLIMNFVLYFFSDKMVLRLYNAKELDPYKYSDIYDIVKELTTKDNLPMPKLWLIENNMANAFATGRNPANSSVAVTSGILQILDKRELRGVLAHELSHVKNRDILVSTIAATLAGAISMLANIRYRMNYRHNDKDGNSIIGVVITFVIVLVAPLIATIIRAAISRSREFMADESGAKLSQDPLALASALEKLQDSAVSTRDQAPKYGAASTLFIVNPFNSASLLELFSTHPPVAKRVRRLEDIYKNYVDDMNIKQSGE